MSAEYLCYDSEGWKLVWNQKRPRKFKTKKQKTRPKQASAPTFQRCRHFQALSYSRSGKTYQKPLWWTVGDWFPVMDTPTETKSVTWWVF